MTGRGTPRPRRRKGLGRTLAASAMLIVAVLGPRIASNDASAQIAATASTGTQACSQGTPCQWTGTWATALTPASPFDTGRSLSGFENESIRMIVQTSIGGELVRIRLSNAHGVNDVTIGHATVGRPTRPSVPDVASSSIEELSFGGSPSVTLPVGGNVVSDPVRMFVPPLSQLAVTIYLPYATGPTSWHWFARQTAFIYDGDHASTATGEGYTSTLEHFFFLAGVEVQSRRRVDGAVAVFGASISDGFGASVDTNHRWPDFLARRILRDERHRDLQLGVVNVSLSGNATTHDGDEVEGGLPEVGVNGLDRLSHDVDTQPGLRTVIVDLGLNDIFRHDDPPDRIIGGLQEIAAALHQRGLRVLLATLSPAAGSGASWTPEREATRMAVNSYIRTTDDADGVVDIDRAVRDPADPTRLNPLFYSTDQVHPNDLGNRAIADIVFLGRL